MTEELIKAIDFKRLKDSWMYIFVFRLIVKNFMDNVKAKIDDIELERIKKIKQIIIVIRWKNKMMRYRKTVGQRQI